MKNKKLLIIFFILFSAVIYYGCKKDGFDFSKITTTMEWNPNFALPVGHGTLDMRDLVRDYDSLHLFNWDNTGFLFIMYYDSIRSIPASSLFKISDQNMNESFVRSQAEMSAAGFTQAGTSVSFSETNIYPLSFMPSDASFDSIYIKEATFSLNVSSTFLHTGKITITFPSIKKNGLPYSKEVNINTATGTFDQTVVFYDMFGYKMDLSTTAAHHGELPLQIGVQLTHSGAPVTAGGISVNASLSNIKYISVFGYFGNQVVLFEGDSVNLNMFSEAFDGGFYFEDPQVKIKLKNSFGMPVRFFLNSLSALSTINQTSTNISGSGVPTITNPKNIAYPNVYSQYGHTIKDSIVLNRNNSNIAQAIGISPEYVFFQGTGVLNPALSYTNFITESSAISAEVEVQLPLWGWADGLALQDTEKFDFSKFYHDYHGHVLKRSLFRIYSENGFPVDIALQLYFARHDTIFDTYQIKDSLIIINPVIVPGGNLGSDGTVVSSNSNTSDIVMNEAKLAKMHQDKVTHIFYKAVFKTTGAPNRSVKFYNNYKIKLHVGVQLEFDANTIIIQNLGDFD